MIGQRLAHYDVLEKLGSGGMGEVYRARDTRLDREVALKILPPDVASDPERSARFDREARAVAALRHPNIITIHAVEEHEGVRFIAMELVAGRTLSQVIPAGGFATGAFLDIAIPLADAVGAAHAKGITHRDLKPDNVMIEPDGRVKVLDFGIAKLIETGPGGEATWVVGPGSTQEGRILGTVAYMSPEQAEGKPVDPRSDVFSLGIVLYEMITGERPFSGGTQISTLTAILRDTPPPVHTRKHTAPHELDRIIQRCLEKSPDMRYETARGLHHDLTRLRTVESSQPSVSAAAPALPRKRVTLWAFLGAGVLAVAVLAAWLVSRGGKTEAVPTTPAAAESKPSMIVVFPFENMGAASDQYFASGIAEEITSRLSALSGLGVVSRTTAVQYDRKGKTMPAIAADLGVDYVLDGTVRWARGASGASQVRITPQLIRAREDRQVWSSSYDRSMDEIFRIQSEIAGEVVDKLGMALAPKERDALAVAPTTNVEAYHAYLRAHAILESISFDRDDFDRASALLEEACAKDPQFLRAYADLAKAQAGFAHFAWDPSESRLARSKKAIDRALAIDPESPWSQLGLGYYHYWGRKDYGNAYTAFLKAHQGLPSSSEALATMAYVRRRQAKFDEAASELEKAAALDPKNALVLFTLAETQLVVRRYDDASRTVSRVIELSPETASGYSLKSRIALLVGDVPAAKAAVAEGAKGKNSGETRLLLFWSAIGCRDYDAASRIAESLPEAENAQFGFESRDAARGWVLAFRGDRDGARAEFARALPVIEAYVRAHPDEGNVRTALGVVLAQLGRPEAVREAETALAMYPASQDLWLRQWRLFELATVEMVAGRHDDAIRHLGELLSQPSDQVSVGYLRMSPLFDPLRSHPGFTRLLESAPAR